MSWPLLLLPHFFADFLEKSIEFLVGDPGRVHGLSERGADLIEAALLGNLKSSYFP